MGGLPRPAAPHRSPAVTEREPRPLDRHLQAIRLFVRGQASVPVAVRM